MVVVALNLPEPGLSAEELSPGTRLFRGEYEIERFLNAGGFGLTYVAKNSLDRRVVIKECFPSNFCRRNVTTVAPRSQNHRQEFSKIVALFAQEGRALSRLMHPNIVGIHHVFEDNATAYMAMDYIEGDDLQKLIRDAPGSLTPAQIVVLLHKLLDAIGFVHEHGMLHRDISPDNILIDDKGEPVLIDFGAARQKATTIGDKALSTLRVVKDGYSPQEFYITEATHSPASDLYALAATFHHLIDGTAPANSQSRLLAIADKRPDPCIPLAGRFEGYPYGFLEAIDSAMAVLPRARIQSAREWLDRIAPVDDRVRTLVATGTPGQGAPSGPEGATDVPALAVPAEPEIGRTNTRAGAIRALALTAAAFVFLALGPFLFLNSSPAPATAHGAMQSDPAFAGVDWRIELPFLAEPSDIGATVVAVRPEAGASAANGWLRPGVSITGIEGQSVTTEVAIRGALTGQMRIGPDRHIHTSVQVADEAGVVSERTLAVQALRTARLPDGTQIESRPTVTAWRSLVTAVEAPLTGGFLPGDELLSEVRNGITLDSPEALDAAFSGTGAGALRPVILVLRAGQPVTIDLAALSGS